MPTATKVWNGAATLKRLLVPIAELHAHPDNPRRGDLASIKESLQVLGQYRPIVARPDGEVLAGNHVREAALELGWTHLGVVRVDVDDATARRILLADNRTHDRGAGYDQESLVRHLAALAEDDLLQGTGYTPDDLDGYVKELARIQEALKEEPKPREPLGRVRPQDVREVVLTLSQDQHDDFSTWVGILRRESGLDSVTEVVLQAIRAAALAVNQG